MEYQLNSDLWGTLVFNYHSLSENIIYTLLRSDGFKDSESISYYFREIRGINECWALDHFKGVVKTVVDLGCGPGSSLNYLKQNNIPCIGVDISLQSTKVAHQRTGVQTHCAGFEYLSAVNDETLGGILLNGNNLGLFEDLIQLQEFLENAFLKLDKGTYLVGQSIDPTKTKESIHLQYQDKNIAAGDYLGKVRLQLEYNELRSAPWTLLLLKPDDIRSLLEKTGFCEIEVRQESWGGYYVVARKPCTE